MGQHREHEFRIENNITTRENLTELAAIIGRTVVHAKAYVSGILEIALDDGTVLTVAPKDKYEAWTYTFGNFVLSCPPGGFDRLPL
jgi:1,4-dihydroxy-2-naphthoate octaprenyltransferase